MFFQLAIGIRDFSTIYHIPLSYTIYYEIEGTPQYGCCIIYLTISLLIHIQDVSNFFWLYKLLQWTFLYTHIYDI